MQVRVGTSTSGSKCEFGWARAREEASVSDGAPCSDPQGLHPQPKRPSALQFALLRSGDIFAYCHSPTVKVASSCRESAPAEKRRCS